MHEYTLWMNEPNLDETLKKQLNMLTEEEIKDSFYKHLSFGTAGARGVMGPGPNRFNIYTVKRLALGFAKYIKKISKSNNRSVAISYDNRINSQLFAYTVARVLATEGIKTFITKNLRPTPFLSFMVRHFNCDGGVMITASHNPKEYNGFKAYNHTGAQLVPNEANTLTKEVEKIKNYFYIQERKSDLIVEVDDDLDVLYLDHVKKIQLVSQEKPLKFVYSPLHGTGATLIPKLMDDVGYNLACTQKQMDADGFFSNTKSSNPEELLAYEESLVVAKEIGAHAVLITDPDADRLGIMVKEEKNYQFLNGNQTAVLEAYYILSRLKQQNKLSKEKTIYMSNVTTPLLKEVGRHFNVSVVLVPTGFKFIGEQIEKDPSTFIFGAEESYGSLISPFVRDKDAIQAVLLLVEMVTYYYHQGKTLLDVLLEIYETFSYYSEETLSLTYKGYEGSLKIESILNTLRKNPLYIHEQTLLYYEDYLYNVRYQNLTQETMDFEPTNMLKFYYQNGNQVILRPSGTEPKMKIYFYITGNTMKNAKQNLQKIKQEVLKKVEEV